MIIRVKPNKFLPILVAGLFFVSGLAAQEPNTLWFLNNTARTSESNPAFFSENKFVVGLPLVSGFGFSYNAGFKLGDLFENGRVLADTMKFNFGKMYRTMGEREKANFSGNASMFYFGCRAGKNYFSVSVNEKGYSNGTLSKKFIKYFSEGNSGYFGTESSLGSISFKLVQYRELALGFSHRERKKKFSYGANLKFLFGRMNINSGELSFTTSTSADLQTLQLIPEGSMRISGPVRFETDTLLKTTKLKNDLGTGDYFFNLKNLGLAAGFGFEYRPRAGVDWFFSVTDLGFIPFSNKTYRVDANRSLTYKKSELTQSTDPNAPGYQSSDAAIYAFRDSIPYMITAVRADKTLWEMIPAKVFFGMMYKTGNRLTLGFLQKLQFGEGCFMPVSTISARKDISKNWAVAGTWSVLKTGFLNPGAGVTYTSGNIQFYFATDNIFTVIQPSSSKNVNLQFGLNLYFGND